MSNEAVQCPICSKDFAATFIEAHASTCLFLNESSKNQLSQAPLKRSSSINQTKAKSKSPLAKRVKQQSAGKNSNKPITKSAFVTDSREKTPERSNETNVSRN